MKRIAIPVQIPKKTKEEKRIYRKFRFFFIVAIAIILTISLVSIIMLGYLASKLGLVELQDFSISPTFLLISIAFASLLVGTLFAFLITPLVLQPFNSLIDGILSLSKGNYSTRLDLGKLAGMSQLSAAFNTMAQELENTELLQSDFINNFSHEFKTPVATVISLLEILKKDTISSEKRIEYYAIIEEETRRLLSISTSVLNLSKVENQSILTDCSIYNLSEQIRHCLLFFNKKWEQKNLTPILNLEDQNIYASQALLEHVWINLLDNAIKFADENTELKIDLSITSKSVSISIENTGVEIPVEEQEKIFQKFYQSDISHTKEGNGIGLSIVKRIVYLHKGKVAVSSMNQRTVFTVTLPITPS